MDVILRHASQDEAEAGTDDTIVASPKAVKQAITHQVIERLHQPNGIATLDANTLQPETEVPVRLRETALDARYLTRSDAASRDSAVDSDITALETDLAAKAPLASPALTGNPTAPTPATADNDTSIATTAFVKAQGYVAGLSVTTIRVMTQSAYNALGTKDSQTLYVING